MGKTIIKGIVEAVNVKPSSEGIKVRGAWLNPNERTRQYVAKRKVGEAVYIEMAEGKIAFCGDLRPDDPDKVPKSAPSSPKTAPNSPFQPPSGARIPPAPTSQQKPKLALSQTDRLIIAQVCLKGAIDLAIARAMDTTADRLAEEVDKMAARLEADFYRRMGA